MKYKLILLKDRNILVSDETPKDGNTVLVHGKTYNNEIHTFMNTPCPPPYIGNKNICQKIIAGVDTLPTLIYSDEVKQLLREKYGWIDENNMIVAAQQYALDKCKDNMAALTKTKVAWENGFKAHQSITNKIFSLEDVKKAFEEGIKFEQSDNKNAYDNYNYNKDIMLDTCIQSLQQPIQLSVEVEMIEKCHVGCTKFILNGSKSRCCGETIYEPKITKNSILITKIL